MRVWVWIAVALFALIALTGAWLFALGSGWLGVHEGPGEIAASATPPGVVSERVAVQRRAARARGVAENKQILFGDLHVHTTFSADAFLMSLPLIGGTGSSPPADACDFARYCSALDFWSINDHAEGLSPEHWRETVDSIRQCNAVAGDPENPDLVSYLGWEWSHIGFEPDAHYGHKNVVLLGTGEGEIPTRPIGAASALGRRTRPGFVTRTALALVNGERGRDFATFSAEGSLERCPEGVPVRDLPPDCAELTDTPEALFAKLREWNVPAIVIPHGNAWGIYTPPGASWDKQLPGHDEQLQTLIEVYSGHGSSEEYRDWREVEISADGTKSCPEPAPGYLPSCWRAGELIAEACRETGASAAECEARAAEARQSYVDAGLAGWRTALGNPAPRWLDSGQCTDCFLPAFNYRPRGSVQYLLALRDFSDPKRPKRFELGLIASSDNHTARPGTGYKEFGKGVMTEGGGKREGVEPPRLFVPRLPDPPDRSQPFDPMDSSLSGLLLFENERATGFFYTGGLVAVHSAGRSREAIWKALRRKEVYGTSGPRILLWFDLVDGFGGEVPMGSSVASRDTPRFRARAVGSFEQKPGCPDHAVRGLGPERVADLCLGECYHPSDRRRLITRIEVVRIRPQSRPGEPVGPLIEDPWRSFACAPDPQGCEVAFEDPEFAASARDAVYYVRAIEAPSLAIRGQPIACERDENGRCTSVELCNLHTPIEDPCLGETEERAWSSPIFVDYAR